MNNVIRATFIVLIFLCPASVHASSTGNELKQLIERVQNNPDDVSLRHEVIRLAQRMKSAPSIPEEGRKYMIRGAAAFKSATSPEGFAAAAEEFRRAARIAPWYGDAYFNEGVSWDKAGQYERAVAVLKLAQMTDSTSKDIQDLLYEVEYRLEQERSPARIRQRLEELLRSLDGKQWIVRDERNAAGRSGLHLQNVMEIRGNVLIEYERLISLGVVEEYGSPPMYEGETRERFRAHWRNGRFETDSGGRFELSLDRRLTYIDPWGNTGSRKQVLIPD